MTRKNKVLDYVLLLKGSIPMMVLVAFGLYYFAISKTVDTYSAYQLLKKAEGKDAIGVSSGYTARRAAEVDRLYQRMEVDTLHWKNRLWNYTAELSRAHACPVASYPPVVPLNIMDQPLLMQTLAFKGNFKSLMQVLEAISKERNIGLVHSVRFRKKARDKDIVLSIDMLGKGKGDRKR